ncbi:ribosome maturation factor RimP [Pengzhenrongella sicca]|uniref:Ribosome maturation factor RimP n=1 Tax=Pengzhenrongella sicca TaxID=2819238 RepID=A0A8A4ZFB3_9MICO|nr:ribosome maturation factor RimP [Pengzhenrongella sicca]QTE30584.1 ribosome maturation factor RimP [Pengzhenrongella sicca]
MATPASTQRVRTAVEPVVTAAGLVLDGLEISAAGRRTVVRVTIDLAEDAVGSLDLDTLAAVSREVGAALDAASPVPGEYTLEVSTPGTSRPLTEPRHFKRARTRLVRLNLREGVAAFGHVSGSAFGRITDVTDGRLTLSPVDAATGRDVTGVPTHIALADITSAAVEVELTHAPAGDDPDEES